MLQLLPTLQCRRALLPLQLPRLRLLPSKLASLPKTIPTAARATAVAQSTTSAEPSASAAPIAPVAAAPSAAAAGAAPTAAALSTTAALSAASHTAPYDRRHYPALGVRMRRARRAGTRWRPRGARTFGAPGGRFRFVLGEAHDTASWHGHARGAESPVATSP